MIFLECQIPFANGGKGRPQGRYGGKEGGKGAGAGRGEENDKGPSEGGHSPFRWFFQRLCYGMWLFHLHSTVKNRAFFPVFPLAGSTAKAFSRLSLWSFKKKSVNHFLWHSFFKWLCHSIWLFYFSRMLKRETFSPIFPLTDSMMGELYWLCLWNFKK